MEKLGVSSPPRYYIEHSGIHTFLTIHIRCVFPLICCCVPRCVQHQSRPSPGGSTRFRLSVGKCPPLGCGLRSSSLFNVRFEKAKQKTDPPCRMNSVGEWLCRTQHPVSYRAKAEVETLDFRHDFSRGRLWFLRMGTASGCVRGFHVDTYCKQIRCWFQICSGNACFHWGRHTFSLWTLMHFLLNPLWAENKGKSNEPR